MSNVNKLNKEEFIRTIDFIGFKFQLDYDYFYFIYENVLEVYQTIGEANKEYALQNINNLRLFLYMVHDFYYRVEGVENIEELKKDDNFNEKLVNSIVDKYSSEIHFKFDHKRIVSPYYPPISTVSVYTNFVLSKLDLFKKGEPAKTLLIDMLYKAFSLSRVIITLLIDGYETEAFTTWRTLHETEATLIILTSNKPDVLQSYLQHMKYGEAFNKLLTKEEGDNLFLEIKQHMKDLDLKSKDMKRFIEYGWLRSVPNFEKNVNKFNFRDGVQALANLQSYSKEYQMASEVTHSSPLLIYSRRDFFATISILNLYDSFFRLEGIFRRVYFSLLNENDKQQYDIVRRSYYEDMLLIQKKEIARYTKNSTKIDK